MGKLKCQKGFTLVELIVAIVLAGIVAIIATRLMLSPRFIGVDKKMDIKSQGRYVSETIDNAIKYTNAVFTIPRDSFVDTNLTATWSYIGVKENVLIPKEMNDGVDGLKAKALVHIRSVGSTEPLDTDLDENQTKINNGTDGWFIQTILGFEHTENIDKNTKYDVKYNFTVKPSTGSKTGVASNSIIYGLDIFYQDGTQKVGNSLVDIGTEINSINALQVVYQGSPINPAVAFSFHEEAYKVNQDLTKITKANIMFVLDDTGSMLNCPTGYHDPYNPVIFPDYNRDGKCDICNEISREAILKKNSKSFIEEFTKLDSQNVRIGEISFDNIAQLMVGLKDKNSIASASNTTLSNNIDNLDMGGQTNIGDGLRLAYFNFKDYYNSLSDPKSKEIPTFVVLVTDGEANTVTYKSKYFKDIDKSIANSGWCSHHNKYHTYLDNMTDSNFAWHDKIIGTNQLENLTNNYFFYLHFPKPNEVTNCICPSVPFYVDRYFQDEMSTSDQNNNTVLQRSRGLDYMSFSADKFKNTTDFPKPTLYLINVVSTKGELNDQSKELMDAFGQTDYEKYIYDATTDKTFADAISEIVSDIKVSASLLDGPKL
ncbi:MAG: prepilin-type N-terminal cleavage/methylation domain-containing protein [Oscillospiraceae bacterium]